MIHTTQECRIGDARALLRETPDESIDTVITSPPYWGLRDYGVGGQIGLEPTLEEYHEQLLEVTAECMRVLKPTGVMFWNHGDSYPSGGGKAIESSFNRESDINTNSQPDNRPSAKLRSQRGKCLIMQNERLIMWMIDEQGWILRNRIIWNKPNGMPSSVTDRFSNKYEPVYMLVKSKKYWFDLDAVRVQHKSSPEKYMSAANSNLKNPKHGKICGTPIGKKSFSGGIQNPLGKNPGDVVEMTQVEWLDYCADIWDMFAEEPGDSMKIPTQPFSGSHFATFPTSLIEPMIKAACPAEICSVCGLARERITEKEVEFTSGSGKAGNTPKGKYEGSTQAESGTYDIRMGPKITHHTVGWTSCSCDKGWIAGTVLDPFCGSGTVLEVCRLLNRNAIGFELNPEYKLLIRERSMAHTPPLTAYSNAEQPMVVV